MQDFKGMHKYTEYAKKYREYSEIKYTKTNLYIVQQCLVNRWMDG